MLPDCWKLSHPECIRTYRQQERRDKADQAQLKAAIRDRSSSNPATLRRLAVPYGAAGRLL